VDARTVTAFDVITAFAVPNPSVPSQGGWFFQVWVLHKLPCRAAHSAYFGLAKFYLSQPFWPSTRAKLNSLTQNVNALFRCKARAQETRNNVNGSYCRFELLQMI